MPPIKVQHIVSFSSEDQVHKAENLLKPETYRKWKCACAGEKHASVILQLEKASLINSIDIGNESSAFVEVLVARSSDPEPDFKVLLVASSFMSPMESRQGSNLNRVRMFGSEKLSQPVAKEKWDRVKVVCTQPFSKSMQYGLTFITFHSPGEAPTAALVQESRPRLSVGDALSLKNEEETPLPVGTWFAKQKALRAEDSSTIPAAVRGASYAATTLSRVEERTLKPEKITKDIPRDAAKAGSQNAPEATTSVAPAERHPKAPKAGVQPPKKVAKEQLTRMKAEQASRPARPFREIMKGVRFVLSGFQNPARSQIRDKALEMGARYEADWNNTCTHLVCAFQNTPKYTQVKKVRGRIVTKEWILDSYKEKDLQPWRNYMLGSCDRPVTPEPPQPTGSTPEAATASTSSSCPGIPDDDRQRNGADRNQLKRAWDTPATSGTPSKQVKMSSDVSHSNEGGTPLRPNKDAAYDSGSSDFDATTDVDDEEMDTDDEIERAIQMSKKEAKRSKESKTPSREMSKPEHHAELKDVTSSGNLPDLPAFFKGKRFCLHGDFPEDEYRTLTRYIVGHDGDLEDTIGDSVKFVVTKSDWCEDFEKALETNEELVFVRPRWIIRCHDARKMLPFQPFVVTCGES